MSLGGSGGQSQAPQEDPGRSAEHGVIEEIGPPAGPTAQMAAPVWDRAVVALFAVAIVGGVGLAIVNAEGDAPTGDAAGATPTATAQQSLVFHGPGPYGAGPVLHPGTVEPIPDVEQRRFLEPGTYRLDYPFPVPATFTLPGSWFVFVWAYTEVGAEVNLEYPAIGAEVSLAIVDNLSADPCGTDMLDPPVGPSVDDLVAALTDLEGFEVSAATDIEVDGFGGKQLTMRAPENPSCARPVESLSTWRTATRQDSVGAGQVNEIRILDVEGTRLVISLAHGPAPTDFDRSMLESVVESIELTPTASPIFAPGFYWARTSNRLQPHMEIGERFRYGCPPGGTLFPVWGTRTYTSDSSICSAAVHAGLITLETGGTVTFELRRGRDSYRGTRRHGVTSRDWPQPWPHSFVFVEK